MIIQLNGERTRTEGEMIAVFKRLLKARDSFATKYNFVAQLPDASKDALYVFANVLFPDDQGVVDR